MPQSPKTTGYIQTTPTIKSEMDAKCLSANSTNNNNTIFNFPSVPSSSDDKSRSNNNCGDVTSNGIQYNSSSTMRHHEGKHLDVNDVNVNVNVVASCASSIHETISTSSYSLSSSDLITNSNNNNSNTSTNQSSSNVNVINVCDGGSDKTNTSHGIIITESHEGAGFYDAIKLEENGGGATAIIYETIVIENPSSHGGGQEQLMTFMTGNNNKLIANKNMTLDGVGNGGIIVLTGSLNELLLSQNGHVITSQSSNGAGANNKCLNDVTNPNHIQSIVLNLNSQSSASNVGSGQMTPGTQKSIMVAINPNQQVSILVMNSMAHKRSIFFFYKQNSSLSVIILNDAGGVLNVPKSAQCWLTNSAKFCCS